ncbi:hypothetical protein LR007_02015, partial [candidate division NPL-UPA2 bacterium]|nr:hypothetical protein [candidate division NPL-UPA2 bacterium]
MNIFLSPIILPFIIGILCLLTPKKVREALALLGSLATFGLTIWFTSYALFLDVRNVTLSIT